MFIIDKNKDYYDYLSHVYGVDKKVTFDRRGSIVLTDRYIVDHTFEYKGYSRWLKREKEFFFLLEVGKLQYLFKVFDYDIVQDAYGVYHVGKKFKIGIKHVFDEDRNFFGKPLTIKDVKVKYQWIKRKYVSVITDFKDCIEIREKTFDNSRYPILAETKIPALISAFDMWRELSTYISSLNNDKEVDIVNTDKAKIVNHGFDLKSSFRHPVK